MIATNRTSILVAGIVLATGSADAVAAPRRHHRRVSPCRRPAQRAYIPANYARAPVPVPRMPHSVGTSYSYRPLSTFVYSRYDRPPSYTTFRYRHAAAVIPHRYPLGSGPVTHVSTCPEPACTVTPVIQETPMVEYLMPMPEERVVRYRRCQPSPSFSLVLHRGRPFRLHRVVDSIWPARCRHRHHSSPVRFGFDWPKRQRWHRHDSGFGLRLRW
jgi:hypothetical protein